MQVSQIDMSQRKAIIPKLKFKRKKKLFKKEISIIKSFQILERVIFLNFDIFIWKKIYATVFFEN